MTNKLYDMYSNSPSPHILGDIALGITESKPHQILQIIIRDGVLDSFQKLLAAIDLSVPTAGSVIHSKESSILSIGPQQYLLIYYADFSSQTQNLEKRISNDGWLIDVTGSRYFMKLQGAKTSRLLSRLVPIDFYHLRSKGDFVVDTFCHGIPLTIWSASSNDEFIFSVPISYQSAIMSSIDKMAMSIHLLGAEVATSAEARNILGL
jgi:sarcosine oxidase gamma subunit